MHTSEWTPQETRTICQNLHLKPTVVSAVIPGKTHTQVARKRSHVLAGNLHIDKAHQRNIVNSLKSRGWSTVDCVEYIRAATGCDVSRANLIQRGLWYNGVGKGGR